MASTLTNLLYHLVFSTKDGSRSLATRFNNHCTITWVGSSVIRAEKPLRSAACLIMYIAWQGFQPARRYPTSCEPSSRIRQVGPIVSGPVIDLHGKPATTLSL